MSNITVIGTGYVGLIAGVCFANKGNKVVCVDVDKAKVSKLSQGIPTIYEEGLEAALKEAISKKNLSFSSDLKKSVEESEVIFITVGTPQGKDGEADLSAIKAVAKEIGQSMNAYKVVVNKSTVPVGTAQIVKEIISQELSKRHKEKSINKLIDFAVVSNPEFQAEGTALKDFETERVVIGTDNEKEKEILKNIYTHGFSKTKPLVFMDTKSAELTKYASNAMLALRVSFMNELSALSEKVGANIKDISYGMGLDDRIGPKFLSAGAGYGGSCFPKDVRALEAMFVKNKCVGEIVKAIDDTNERQKERMVEKLKELVPNLKGKKICVLGLSFKPNTDDVRESSSLVLINAILKEGGSVSAFDPKGMENAKIILKHTKVTFSPSAYEALDKADAVAVMTEWKEFKEIDLNKMKKLLKAPNVLDARNIFNPKEMKMSGFNYVSVGR